jgi:serine/threonine protein kinase
MTGTLIYCSPERYKGDNISEKEDAWALGCIAYYLCTFKLPFQMENSDKSKEAILYKQQSPVTTHGEAMRHLIDSLLIKEPEKRPSIDQILKENVIMREEAKVLAKEIEKIRKVNSGQVSTFKAVFVGQ